MTISDSTSQGKASAAGRANSAQRLSEMQLSLLLRLSSAGYPIGARLAREHLVEQGYSVSEASVSRLLLDLDKAGWTARAGAKGRVATDAGKQMALAVSAARKREQEYARALDISTIEQVLDLLRARRAVEGEAARAAAALITDDDIHDLEAVLAEHRDALRAGTEGRLHGLQFHRKIVEISRNPLLIAMSGTLLGEQLEYLEQLIDVITTTNGSLGKSADDHGDILQAFEDREAESAEEIMRRHLNRLIREVEAFSRGDSASAFGALLDLAQR